MFWLITILGVSGFIALLQQNESRTGSARSRKPRPTFTAKPKLNERSIDAASVELSKEQRALFETLEHTDDHIFVTGKAGTGKSVLLQYFKRHSSKQFVVVAPTGVAALNVGGQTIHSLFRIPPAFIAQRSLTLNPDAKLLLGHIDTIVIDEISMVRADLMDAIDHLLRQARNQDIPFGGVQLIMFGDLYQLSPIVSDAELQEYFAENHGGFYFFNAHVWREAPLKIYELSTVFRQKDEHFRSILNAIRTGTVSPATLEQLNARASEQPSAEGIITLAATNAAVSALNHRKLLALPGAARQYKAAITGNLEPSAFPTDGVLNFKKGAQIMMLKNDPERRWVNGTLGYIESLSMDSITVNIDGYTYPIMAHTWDKIQYRYDRWAYKIEEDIVSSFTQYPLRLAWAITIHKSQGQTYEAVDIDLGGRAFAHGQTYVALSRCKSLDKLYLRRPISMRDIIVDPQVVAFMGRADIHEPSLVASQAA